MWSRPSHKNDTKIQVEVAQTFTKFTDIEAQTRIIIEYGKKRLFERALNDDYLLLKYNEWGMVDGRSVGWFDEDWWTLDKVDIALRQNCRPPIKMERKWMVNSSWSVFSWVLLLVVLVVLLSWMWQGSTYFLIILKAFCLCAFCVIYLCELKIKKRALDDDVVEVIIMISWCPVLKQVCQKVFICIYFVSS